LYPLEFLDVQDAVAQQSALERYHHAMDLAMASAPGEHLTQHLDALWRAIPGVADGPAGMIPDVFEKEKLEALKNRRAGR
jgi:hypothetical protein